MHQFHLHRIGMAAAALLAAAPLAAADDGRGPLDQKVNVSLGGFFMNLDTDVRLDGTAGRGDDINWESEFGLPDQNRFRIDAFWRFAKRHKARLMYFQNNRSGSKTLDRDITFGDTTFPVNADASVE